MTAWRSDVSEPVRHRDAVVDELLVLHGQRVVRRTIMYADADTGAPLDVEVIEQAIPTPVLEDEP